MRIVRTRMFQDSLERLKDADSKLFEVVAVDVRYLLRMKRAAVMPQVRFGIAQSAYPDDTGEVRSHIPGHQEFVRTLFAMPADESVCLFAVLGDKNAPDDAHGNEWYDAAVPLLDEAWQRVLAEGEPSE